MVGALVAVALSGVAPASQARGVSVAVRETQGVLVAAHPELAARRMTRHVAPTATGLELEATDRVRPTDATPVAALLTATVTVDEQGRLAAPAARGTLIDVARQQVGARSGDAEADLNAVRAKFPPGDAPQDARTWRVELETDDPTGRPYTLVFEPVEGRLLSVVRR